MRSYKPGHRVAKVKTEKPTGTSWWTQAGRAGFTTEAEKREPEMRASKIASFVRGVSLDLGLPPKKEIRRTGTETRGRILYDEAID